MTARILLVEDDDGIALPLIRTFEREGYAVVRVSTGTDGLQQAVQGPVDLVFLDLGLPDLDGLEVCRQLRASGFEGGVMIFTARAGEIDRVVGLDVGADDYLAKPFPLAELLARIRALLRRTSTPGVAPAPVPSAEPTAAPDTSAARLRVDRRARRVWVGPQEVSLTTKEFELLALLEEDPGSVVRRERLMAEVWDENWFGSTRTLDVTMSRLRQKLDEAGAPVQVVTVRGVGFRLEPSGAQDA